MHSTQVIHSCLLLIIMSAPGLLIHSSVFTSKAVIAFGLSTNHVHAFVPHAALNQNNLSILSFKRYYFEQQHKIIRLYELFVFLFNIIFVIPIFQIGIFDLLKLIR